MFNPDPRLRNLPWLGKRNRWKASTPNKELCLLGNLVKAASTPTQPKTKAWVRSPWSWTRASSTPNKKRTSERRLPHRTRFTSRRVNRTCKYPPPGRERRPPSSKARVVTPSSAKSRRCRPTTAWSSLEINCVRGHPKIIRIRDNKISRPPIINRVRKKITIMPRPQINFQAVDIQITTSSWWAVHTTSQLISNKAEVGT